MLNLTRDQVAARTGGNVSGSGLGKIERGEVESPNGSTLEVLGRVLGINSNLLMDLRDGRIQELPPEAFFEPMREAMGTLAPPAAGQSPVEWASLLIRFTNQTAYQDQHEALSRMLPREVTRLRDLLNDFLKPANEARAAG